MRLTKLISLTALLALNACALLGPEDPNKVDCDNLQSSCHSGRFGLIWSVDTPQGEEKDSVSGTYEWRSGRSGASNSMTVAWLEVNSTLGPNLGVARRNGDFYEVRAADGRVYVAKDWQTLFDLIFPVKLPADALIAWMENPRNEKLPPLPENWTWENRNGKYRINFVESGTRGRVDLIPQYFE